VSDKPPVPDREKSSVKLKASPPQSGEYTSS